MTDTESPSPAPQRKRRMAREPRNGAPAKARNVSAPAERQPAKTSVVIDLLGRPEGATLEQLIAATGWLPHTTRAALTGLKKKGHSIASEKPAEGTRIYRIVAARENAA
ncbi:DUF3489 domain-containing protein [Novosphingobium flavum]|nr:DUF3489 domain-containing protein [Novosphingobium flavum]